MSCKCNEKSKCKKSLSTLRSVLKKLKCLADENHQITNWLSDLESTSTLSFTTVKMEQLSSVVCDLNSIACTSTTGAINKISDEIDRLNQLLDGYTSEDEDYHASIDYYY